MQLNRYTQSQCYISYVRPLLEYANIVFDNCTEHDKSQLENIQYKALLLITGAKQGTSYERLIEETGFQTIKNRRTMQKVIIFYKLVHTKDPVYPVYQNHFLIHLAMSVLPEHQIPTHLP